MYSYGFLSSVFTSFLTHMTTIVLYEERKRTKIYIDPNYVNSNVVYNEPNIIVQRLTDLKSK